MDTPTGGFHGVIHKKRKRLDDYLGKGRRDAVSLVRRKARMENLGVLMEVATDLAAKQGFNEGRLHEVELAMEEALVNIFHYAYPEGQPGDAEVKSGITEEGHLLVEITDQGIPFDIQSVPEPDLKSSLSERSVGGLGIHLIRTMADHMAYLRKADANILTLIFKKSR
jgi:serine/threonine-protein kinase RsbW